MQRGRPSVGLPHVVLVERVQGSAALSWNLGGYGVTVKTPETAVLKRLPGSVRVPTP